MTHIERLNDMIAKRPHTHCAGCVGCSEADALRAAVEAMTWLDEILFMLGGKEEPTDAQINDLGDKILARYRETIMRAREKGVDGP